jgi:hypothetical protein
VRSTVVTFPLTKGTSQAGENNNVIITEAGSRKGGDVKVKERFT